MTRAAALVAAVRVAVDGIIAGFGVVLIGVLPSMVTSLALGSGFPGLCVSLAAFAYMGVVNARRKAEREALARRLVELEAVALFMGALEAQAAPAPAEAAV